MKKLFDGRVYDTDKAEWIADDTNNYPMSDFRWYEEALYKTKKGAWFLHGTGGPMTRWAESDGNTKTSGEDIRPLTDGEALQWLEEHDEVEIARFHFSLPEA